MYINNCRIGIISWPSGFDKPVSDKHTFIHLGDIYDKNIKKDMDKLYEIHNSLNYMYPFKAIKNKNKIIIDNNEDFNLFRLKYKITLTTKLYNYNNFKKDNRHIVFKSPKLYDISCMKPIFTKIPKLTVPRNINSDKKRIFIVLPYPNPIVRGKIIDECIEMIKNYIPLFVLIGDKYKNNKETTSSLMERYLYTRGVNSKTIIKSLYDKFPESIAECFTLLNCVLNFDTDIYDIFIATSSKDIYKVMYYMKSFKSFDINLQTLIHAKTFLQ